MARVYLSVRYPRGRQASKHYFPKVSGEVLNQQSWALLGCGHVSWISKRLMELVVLAYTYLCLMTKYFICQWPKVNMNST